MIGRWRQRVGTTAAALLLAGLPMHCARAQEAVYDVDEVKAAFLYHFGAYVSWPAPSSTDALTIAVLDDDRVAEQLALFLPGRRIEERAVDVRKIAQVEELGDAEILFIGRSSNARLAQVITAIGTKPVLVVTDAPDGLDNGGMINFQEVESRLRFEISVPRAEEAGLTFSSRLLAAALRVVTSHCCVADGVQLAANLTE